MQSYAPQFLTNSTHTLKGYKTAIELYICFLDECGVTFDQLCRHHFEKDWIENWIIWLKDSRGNSPETCNNRLASLRRFLEYLADQDASLRYLYLESKLVKRQKCHKTIVHGMSKKAVAAVLATPDVRTAIGRRDLTFLTLLYGTAARLGEILSLKLVDVHLNVRDPYVTLTGKGGKIRTVYILPRAVELLKAYIKEFHGTAPNQEHLLFYSRMGENAGNQQLTGAAINKRIRLYATIAHETCSEVPLQAHAHTFRHAKASHWLEDGMNLFEIQALLGHEQVETTMRYLDISIEQKRMALTTLEQENDALPKWKTVAGEASLRKAFGLH